MDQSKSPVDGVDSAKGKEYDVTGVLSISTCASKMAAAVAQVISLGEKESRKSSNQVYSNHMTAACETLDLAKTNLFVTAQRFEIEPDTPCTGPALCQAAKDVLQGVLKVMLVIDDEKVSRLVAMISQVQNKLGAVGVVDRTDQLVPSFRDLTDAILRLKSCIDPLKEDLRSDASRDQIGVCFAVLRKCVPSLSMAMQTFLKYKSNFTAQGSRDLVLQQMYTALKEMQTVLQSGTPSNKEDDRQGGFVYLVDQIMEYLSEAQRPQLSIDFESTLVAMVGHSMSVSHFYNGPLRELIITSCHRILQAKFRLLDLSKARLATPHVSNIEDEYDGISEMILDETCDLEKHVNMTILHLIVDTFLETSLPLDKLVKAALGFKSKTRSFTEAHGELMSNFTEHSDLVCNVALLVAASSTDAISVSDIRSSVMCLESTDPDIIPAVVSVAKEPSKMASVRHLRLLVKRWQIEMETIVRAIDKIVDPHVFLDVTEHKISDEISSMKGNGVPVMDPLSLKPRVHHCLALAERAAQLGTRLVENHTDPIYRNGLMVFVRKVSDAVALARASANDVLVNPPSSKLLDTMDRRLKLLQGSVVDLRQGLNPSYHPHIMSEERCLTRQRSSQFVSQDDRVKEKQPGPSSRMASSSSASLKSQVSVSKLTQAMESKLNADSKTAVDSEDERAAPSRSSGVGNVYSWPASPQMDEITVSPVPRDVVEAAKKEESKEPQSSIQLLVSRLLTAATERDRISTDNLTSDLLGWTNHVVDAGDLLMVHCSDIYKREELKAILREVDEIAPEVIQRSKFMVLGDKEGQDELYSRANEWGQKLERARVIVDVAADRWLLLTDSMGQAMQTGDEDQVRKVLMSINLTQQEMSRLLLKTRFLSGRMMNDGVQIVGFLTECLKDMENLAITISTSVDVTAVSVSRTVSDKWQLVQVSRDWSVLMTCVVAEMDKVANSMEELGKKKFPGLRTKQGAKNSRLSDVLERETNQLLELVDCIVSGDSMLKAKSEELAADINDALVDVVGIMSQTILSSEIPQHVLFSRLRIGLARCRWIEKALEIRDLIQHHTFEFSGCVRHALHTILDFRETGPTADDLLKEEHRLCSWFLEISASLKQKALAAVQLSSDLPRRAVVRSSLDSISELTSKIHAQIKDPNLCEADIAFSAEQWGANIKKLTWQLKKLDGVKQSTVSDIEKLTKSTSPSRLKKESLMIKGRQEQNLATPNRSRLNSSDSIMSTPLSKSSYAGLQNQASSPFGKSVSMLLKGAEFLDNKFTSWDWIDPTVSNGNGVQGNADGDIDQPWSIAHHARSMARLSSNMALYTRGQGPFKSSEEVVGAAVAMTRHSAALEELGQTLSAMVIDSRCTIDLKASISRMNSMTSQLHIIATALHNSARSCEGDRMLVRNAYNLLSSVKDLLARMESAALLEIREPDVVDAKTRSILSLLRRVCEENDRYVGEERSTADIDELGLRRVERHNPPTLTSLVKP